MADFLTLNFENLDSENCGFFESKGSKFYAHLCEFENLDSEILTLRTQNPKAVHFVSASRHLNEFSQVVERANDDGEPKGSSGVPALNVLRGENLINVGVVIVRYFGGTLLGVGGLVRAYTAATLSALQNAKDAGAIVEFVQLQNLSVEIEFANFAKFQHHAQKLNLKILQKYFDSNGVKVVLQGRDEELQILKNKMQNKEF